MMQNQAKRSIQSGVTLIEALTVLTIVGVLLTLTAPSLKRMVQTRRLEGAVQTYLSQLHWARLQAVALNQSVHLTFNPGRSGSCYVFYVGERDQCRCVAGTAECAPGARALMTQALDAEHGISLQTNSPSSVTVDALRGTISPTFVAVFSASDGQSVQATTSVMGRTRSCSTAPSILGLPVCA